LSHRVPNTSRTSKFPSTGVYSLNFSKREFTKVPSSLVEYANNLFILDLSSNRFTDFPAEIFQLTKLKTLKFESNYLKKIPSEISKLTQLEHLSLANNYLLTLPKSIAQLSGTLKYLDISHNHVELLP